MKGAFAGDTRVPAGAACKLNRAIDHWRFELGHLEGGKHFRAVSFGEGFIAMCADRTIGQGQHLITRFVEERLASPHRERSAANREWTIALMMLCRCDCGSQPEQFYREAIHLAPAAVAARYLRPSHTISRRTPRRSTADRGELSPSRRSYCRGEYRQAARAVARLRKPGQAAG
jgi:hypothetical protein